jgi:aquaporin Z
MIPKKAIAEAFGTFWLVFGGVGSALFLHDPVGVAFAFGLTVVTMAYSIGHISGAHLNPAVSVGAFMAGRLSKDDLPWYVGAQIAGGLIAAIVLGIIVSQLPKIDLGGEAVSAFKFAREGGFGSNHYGSHGGAKWLGALLIEIILTFVFIIVILGATDRRAPVGFAGLAIGLALTLIHLISMPLDGTSVNPARSIGPALFSMKGWAIGQLWCFIIGPTLGGAGGGWVYKNFLEKD